MTGRRAALLDATIGLVRERGYAGARIDDIAARAGVTKGSFFHHFSDKDACALAAADYWTMQAEAVFASSGHRDAPTPKARVLAYVDFRVRLITGPVEQYSCFAGGLLNEVHQTHPDLAAACARSISTHAETLTADLADALGDEAGQASGLALHIQAVVQGALLIAKTEAGPEGARASLLHLRRYLESLLKDEE